MVEFAFFRNRQFVGANAVAFIVSFAMLGMFFFMALYMQNILGYSPLEAGRPLPALDAHDRDLRAALGAPHRPHRAPPADRRRAR